MAGSPSSTMWPVPRPTSMPSFILIHPTVWPQYTNVTDRQDIDKQERQRSDSIGRTIFWRPFVKRFALCHRTVVLSCLSVTLVYCSQTWMDHQNETWHGDTPVVRCEPSSPPCKKGHRAPIFGTYLLWTNGWMD